MNSIRSLLMLVLVGILACSFASAAVEIVKVELDDDELDESSTSYIRAVEKGDEFEVKVHVRSDTAVDNVRIDAELAGDVHDDIIGDATETFDMKAGVTYVKELDLKLTKRMEQDTYTLYVDIRGRYEDQDSKTYSLEVDAPKHMMDIRDIILSPENEVKAGRALLVAVRVKNRGEEKEEDIKVKASIPALGISASDYIDELDEEDCDDDDDDCDDSTTSEELYMRIPDCAEPGEYTVRICVEYDDGDEEICETTKVNVVESDTCVAAAKEPAVTGKTIITIGPETQDVAIEGSAMYPVTIANQGAESKVYSISVDSADWADFSVTPSNVLVVGAGESKAAYISVRPKATATGLQVFSATIKSGESVLKQVPLRANIVGGAAVTGLGLGRLKRALEIGLVVLVVLLVILGLIIGFNKLKGSEEEEETGEEKTYY